MTGCAPTRVLASLVLSLLAALPAAGGERQHHILWTVQGRHNTVYLLGSVHVLRAQDAELPRAALDAYDDAERLVMELDMDALLADPMQTVAATQRLALLPGGQSLRDVLGADYPPAQARALSLGLDLDVLDRFQPWFVATALLQAELARRGFSPDLGVDETLARRAMADHKPITGLETVEEQLGILAALPMGEQRRFLRMTIEEMDDFDREVGPMLDAWRAGDAQRLARVLSEGFDQFPELYRPLTEDRNRRWAGEIAAFLDDDEDYLVVVGALHLVGRNSVVELLQRRGYRVTQQ